MPSNLQPTRDLIADWRPDDAGKLARLWNEMGPAWPGNWGGPRHTPEEAEREMRSEPMLAAFVAEHDGKYVAFANLIQAWEKPHNVYVGLLTGHPDYLGMGFGKAVLLSCIEAAFRLGYPRVSLGTWAGNTKAVPLYKKSGFMWVPDTHPVGVHMENFTPFARRHPIGRAFFAENDWYDTLKRDVSLKEDLHRRGKVKVFPYEWRGKEGRFLRMVFDPQSWGLLAIETNEFRAGCFLPDEKLICGLPYTIRWEVVNKTGKPIRAGLEASASKGVNLRFSRAITLNDRAELQAQFVVDPMIPEKKTPPRVPIITTRLDLDGRALAFKAGFRPQQPISVGLEWPTPSLAPAREEKVFFHVRSHLDKKARARIRLKPGAGASLKPWSATVSLPAKGAARIGATAKSARSGKMQIAWNAQVSVGGRTVRPKPGKLALVSAGPTECVGFVHRDEVVLQSAALRASISRWGFGGGIHRRLRPQEENIQMWMPALGPPFHWDEFSKKRCRARIEQADGKVTAVLEAESCHRCGVWLQRRITLGNEPVIQIVDAVHNRSSSAYTLARQFAGRPRGERRAEFVAPVEGKTTSSSEAARSLGDLGLPNEAERWPEGWLAHAYPAGWAGGFLWRQAERIDCGRWGSRIETPLGSVPSGESRTCEPVYLYLGEGDAATVQRWWRHLFRPETAQAEKPKHSPSIEFRIEPEPLVISRQGKALLKVSAIGRKELKGNVALALPAGFSPGRLRQKGFDFGAGREFSKRFFVRRQARVREGAYDAELTLDDGDHMYRRTVAVIALGSGGERVRVSRAKGGLFEIFNGRLRLKVAPAFSGTAVALEYDGANWLRSSYPTAGPMAWYNPWHGGICPELERPREQLHKYKCRASVCGRKGQSGAAWRGVRLTWDRKKEEHGGVFRFRIEYLLAPRSALVAVVIGCEQRGCLPADYRAGFHVYPLLGGSHLDAVLCGATDTLACRKRTDFEDSIEAGSWVLAENPKTGHAMMLIGGADDPVCHGHVLGRDGYYLKAGTSGRLEPKQSAEKVCYVVISPTSAEAKPWSALAEAGRLL